MPRQRKQPPGGSKGPQDTRVYAPTHRASVASRGSSGGDANRRAPAPARPNSPRSQQRPNEGQAKPSRQGQAHPSRQGQVPSGQGQGAPRSSAGQAPAYGQEQARRSSPNSQTRADGQAYRPDRTRRQGQSAANTTRLHRPSEGMSARERLAAQAKAQLGGLPPRKQEDGQRTAQRPHNKKREDLANVHRIEPVGRGREHQKSQPKQKRVQKEREPMDRKKLLTYLSLVVASIGLLLIGYFVFLLDTVAVDGNAEYTDENIIELSRLTAGTHMLLCDLGKAKSGIESNPYLQVISVERELPRTIRIQVKERKEVAAIAGQGYDVIIDEMGHVLSIGGGSDLSALLRVTGLSQLGFHINQKLGTNTDFQTRTLLAMLEQLEAFELMDDAAALDLSNPLNVSLLTRDGVTVTFGQPDGLAEKFSWMRDALPSLHEGGITGGSLDVSAKGGAIYSPADENTHSTDDVGQGDDPGPEDDTQEPPQPDPEEDTPAD